MGMQTSSAAALRLVGLALAAALTLAACGDDSGDGTATDPGGSTSPTPTASPTAGPTVGTYPPFGPQDYDYTLRVSCFCPDAGVPISVTVRDGDVTEAVYAESGRGVHAGEAVEEYRWLTINDVIDAANDTEADSVQVTWPDGQDYPTSVYVDQDEMMVDEEIGYAVSDVVVD
jgi:hypothetical protein